MQNQKTQSKIPTIGDTEGHQYQLLQKIGEGGQGIVIQTQYPDILVKLCNKGLLVEKQTAWLDKIRLLMTQNLHGLNIAYPLAIIEKPRAGYVMKLMDGLHPLSTLFDQMQTQGVESYAPTGGLLRRLKILAKLARSLAELHGRGLVYGDLSPNNIFISQDVEYDEVWLIDCDNISALSRLSQQKIHTPDYGAPEIMREESGINSYTDSWCFSVIAYRLLTGNHPLKGDFVVNGDVELEQSALRGEIAWVNDSQDDGNRTACGLSWDLVCDKYLKALFERCFSAGLNEPSERPSLSEWAETFENAVFHTAHCQGCQNTFIANKEKVCPFCDTPQSHQEMVFLTEYQFIPKDILQQDLNIELKDEDCWLKTDKALVLNAINSVYFQGIKITLQGQNIIFDNPQKEKVYLRQGEKAGKLPAQYSLAYQGSREFYLHFGTSNDIHLVWKFFW